MSERLMISIVQEKLPRVKFAAGTPGGSYMPHNGSEGEYWFSMWCEECARDKGMNGEATQEQADRDPSLLCEIVGRSFCHDAIPEWIYGDDGQPKCIQFVPKGQTITERCTKTIDMFGEPQP